MKYRFKPHHSKMTTICAAFGAGTRAEFGTQYPRGMAHFQEHARFKGTPRFNHKELAEKVSLLGGDWNAFTSSKCVAYYMEVPAGNEKAGLELLSEVALFPSFPETEIEKEKGVVCQEICNYNDDLDSEVYDSLYTRVFNNALSLSTLGTEESVKSITRDDLTKFDKEFYSTDKLLLILATSNGEVGSWVPQYFTQPDGVWNVKPETNATYADSFEHRLVKEGFEQSSIMVARGSSALESLSRTNQAALGVFNYIFGSGADSRLFQKVREDLGLVYGIYSRMDRDLDGSLFEISTSTDPKNVDAVLTAVSECMTDFKSLKENELLKAKNCLKSMYFRSLDTSASVAMDVIGEELFGISNAEFVNQIENVTEKEVLEAAEVVFAANQYTVVGNGS